MKDTFAPRLAVFYAALFAFSGVQMPFFPVWLEAKGLDARAIGVILAVPLAVRVLIVPLTTRLIDRFSVLEAARAAAALGALGGYVLVGSGSGFSAIFAAVALASIALTPLMPLADAYALRGLAQRSKPYGAVRLWARRASFSPTWPPDFCSTGSRTST
ncbi:MAG TPA: MFS transporter [Xanthobacteraceae bacterium]|nr:MFS transporter [Xanthobacteraceae bacterium]